MGPVSVQSASDEVATVGPRAGARSRLIAVFAALSLALAACQTAPQQGGSLDRGAVPAVAAVETAPLPEMPGQVAELGLAPGGQATPRAYSAIVVDAASGAVLHEEAADGLR